MKRLNLNSFNVPFLMKGILIVALAFTVLACEEDTVPTPVDPVTKDIMEIVDETADVSTLKAAIDAAGLRTTLEGDGPFTVFAPTNAAFDALEMSTPGIIQYLLDNPDELTKVLTYHVVAAEAKSTDLIAGPYETVNGQTVEVDLSSGVKVNDATVTAADVLATNGVIHLIDKVLVPDNLVVPELRSIVDIAAATPTLSILVEALTLYPDLVELLSADGTFTVFAPTNAAFEALLPVIKQGSINDIPEDVLKNILQYHVIAGSAVLSTDLAAGDVEAANGEMITIAASGESFTIGGQAINMADVDASNGVIHIMDGVLVPPSVLPFVGNALTFAYFSKDFTTLVAAVSASDPSLVPALQSGTITLFAPTNDAFAAAGITEIPAEPTLSAVLTYHVLGSVVKAEDIPTTQPAAPLKQEALGGDLYISNQGGDAGVFINGSTQVTATNLMADNGAVVHVINQTLVPASMSIAAIATDLGFTRLVDALVEAGLDQTFVDPGNYTVFAPTNAAFDALYTALGVSTTDPNPEKQVDIALGEGTLAAVLTYHVVGARVFSTDLADGLAAGTLQGGNVTVNVTANGVTLTDIDPDFADANVTVTDVTATNGVIHAIDAVLLPVDL